MKPSIVIATALGTNAVMAVYRTGFLYKDDEPRITMMNHGKIPFITQQGKMARTVNTMLGHIHAWDYDYVLHLNYQSNSSLHRGYLLGSLHSGLTTSMETHFDSERLQFVTQSEHLYPARPNITQWFAPNRTSRSSTDPYWGREFCMKLLVLHSEKNGFEEQLREAEFVQLDGDHV